MEKLLNHYDREYMKMAMLKHEETFREQVYELHRLYQIQKMLMKDIAKNKRKDLQYGNNCKLPEARLSLDLERPAEEFNAPESGGAGECRVSEPEDDQGHDLELTLGPRSYRRSKLTKAAEAADPPSDSGRSFSSSSTGSSHIKGTRISTREELLSQQKWALEKLQPVSNQDRLNSPPWLFQALSLNMT
ncbi:uncharacterized protein LOC105177798 [Sesamum indicum]|uniref:Uncharacterized protein LOC105177798 n=1 Tax=Sesamum indicum TaxID=4182 RepID=A0A6I9UGN9_SESIN|nr:uncharacterized protein LOC105177798 [Sesamum indicum]